MNYTHAMTLDEAVRAVAAGSRPIAGGSDLVVGARQGKAPLPGSLVGLGGLAELTGIRETAAGLHLGALVTHHEIEHHPLIAGSYSALADASALVGSPSTRNVGTLGGNVMNASPAMDTGAPLLVLGATVTMMSVTGSRSITLDELWVGPGRTSAAPDELCVGFDVPAAAPGSGSAYVRLEYRRAMEIAIVGAAAAVTLGSDGTVAAVAVALTAVAPTIVRVDLPGLAGASIAEAARAASEAASAQARPISDLRASDGYRRHTVGVMAHRAVEAAARRAGGDPIGIPVNRSLGIGAAR